MAKEMQAVGFRVGRQMFALPIAVVQEIVRPPEITVVPHAPQHVEGVINLRGRIVPVIDLRKRFGEPVNENGRKTRILVIAIAGRTAGLLVDSASEVLKIADTELDASPKLFGETEDSCVAGVAKCAGRLIVLLQPEKIVQPGEIRVPEFQS
jgi:purine-binding chemotaxis protein CheW